MRAWFASSRNDIAGGLVSAAVAIPLAMGYGMFAFVALGDAYFAHGVLAGLYTAIIVAVVSVATGDRTTTVYAPRVVTTFFLGSLVFALAHSDAPIIRTGNVDQTLAIIFSIILVGGAFQALFGLMRLGTLIKHTPHPVMAGFQNAAALLLFLVQIGNVLGYGTHTHLAQLVPNLGSAKPLSVAVALVTMAVMWHARRVTASIPPLVAGLVAGTAVYHALSVLGFSSQLGLVIGSTPAVHLGPWNLSTFAALIHQPRFPEMTMQPVAVARATTDRKMQRALLQFFKPENYFETRRALLHAGRGDLIGDGCDALIPATPPRAPPAPTSTRADTTTHRRRRGPSAIAPAVPPPVAASSAGPLVREPLRCGSREPA